MCGSEAEHDDGTGVGRELGLPAMVGLVLEHGGFGLGIPLSARCAVQVFLADKRALDLGRALGINRALALRGVGLLGLVRGLWVSGGRGTLSAIGEYRSS